MSSDRICLAGWCIEIDTPDMNEVLLDIRALPKFPLTPEEIVQMIREELGRF